jgi:leader peptidase (prepilin peptidase)/N-methyltransferase
MTVIEAFQAYPFFYVATALVVGLLVGSFLNVVIYRLPEIMMRSWRAECQEFLAGETPAHGEKTLAAKSEELEADNSFNLAFPASHCPKCKAEIKPWHNIPLLSYLLLKGKCHSCKTKISARYPIIELVTGVLTAVVAYHFGATTEAFFVAVFTWSLIALTMIDVDHQLLPDSVTLPLLWLGLLVNSFGFYTDLQSAVFGAVAGYLSLWSVYWVFKLLTKKEGMGYGDFKLLAAMGAWMGWQALPVIIILSSFVGAAIGIAGILVAGKDKNVPIPFGPYLAIAGWVAFLWGDLITQQYLQFAGIAS